MTLKVIAETVCSVSGHHIQTLKTKELVDPVSKSVIGTFESLCTKCGMSLEEIRKSRTARVRKSKPAEQPAESVTA